MEGRSAVKKAFGTNTLNKNALKSMLRAMHADKEEELPAVVHVLSGVWIRNPDTSYRFVEQEDV